jgi:cardiolipin synthase
MATNLPNLLSYSRIAITPVVVGLLMFEGATAKWVALGFYTAACITDFLDGYLARAWQLQSSLGRFLDPIADKLLISAILLVLVGTDVIAGLAMLPALVILCREILVSGLREYLAEVRVGVPVSHLAKWKTGLQMTAIGFLVVGRSGPDFFWFTTIDIGIIGLWIAAALTVITGYDYLHAGYRHIDKADTELQPSEKPIEAGD